jgi:ABC-type dipeptide/oligopeptide/nickel transport system permease component
MLIVLFAVTLPRWLGLDAPILPPTGTGTWQHYIMPVITLAANSMAIQARMTRACMLEVLRTDYIRTARAKGLAEWKVIYKHALRNALVPIVTIIGLQFGTLLGGAVLTETVFAWPGIGRLLIDAISFRDYPVIQGTVLFIAVGFVLVNLLVDVLYAYLDPRIRYN